MSGQEIIAAVIIVSAVGYVGLLLSKRIKAFAVKNKCAADCGCDSKSDRSVAN